MGAIPDGPHAAGRLLRPYVCPLAVEWLASAPELRYRALEGTLVFADVSGFTRLTERLASKGKAGAEEISDLLDVVLAALLTAASDRGGWLVKWGGDALLLMFDGDGHAERACRAAADMRAVIAKVGRLETSVGRVRLKMSVAVNSGKVDFVLAGKRHRELIVTGETATITAGLESDASAGEILLGKETAALLPGDCLGEPVGGGVLLARAPQAPVAPPPPDDGVADPVGLEEAMDGRIAAALLAGAGAGEHRGVAVAFIEFRGVAETIATRGLGGFVDAVDALVTRTEEAAHRFEVTFHETDIGPDGGKILLVAGAPTALDGLEEAILGTVREVMDGPTPLRLRAGVTCGRVFSGALGPPSRRSWSIKGDVVNLAARIMGKAEPGEVLAVREVVDGSRTAFRVSEREPFRVKGKKKPVHASVVGDALSRSGEDESLTARRLPLAGREKELEAFRAALARASESGTGTMVDVVAPAGMGKSRLLRAFADSAPLAVFGARGEPFRTETPYHVLGPLIRQALGLGSADSPEAEASRLAAWANAVAPHLSGWAPLLGRALGVELPETEATAALDENYRAARLYDTVIEALEAALPAPAVFVVDDVHYADEASLAALRVLSERLAEHPWVLVLARRGGDEPVVEGPVVRRLELAPLSSEESARLLDDETEDAPLPRHIAESVLTRAAGQPLFLRELARVARFGEGELPDTIERVIAARIDALPPPDRLLLRACALQGGRAEPRLVARLLETDNLKKSDWARLGDFLMRDGSAYRFRESLVREVAYEGLPFRQRARLHGRLADILSTRRLVDEALLGEHYFRAARYEPALTHSRSAAHEATSRFAFAEAASSLERALASARRIPGKDRNEIASILYELGEARRCLGEFSAAEAAYASARRVGTDPLVLARSTERWAVSAHWRGAYELAQRRVRRGLALLDHPAGGGTDGDLAAIREQLLMREAFLLLSQGRLVRARTIAEGVVARGEAVPAVQRAWALQLLDAIGAMLGDDGGDSRYAEESLALFKEAGHLLAEGRLLIQLGARAYYAGQWITALERYEQAREACARAGDVADAAVVTSNIAEVLVEQWRLEPAEMQLREVLRIWRASGAENLVGFALALLGRTLARAGSFEEARHRFDEARATFVAQGSRADLVDVDAYLAEAALLEGRHEEALSLARKTLRKALALSELPVQGPLLHRVMGAALEARLEWEAAERAYGEAVRLARERSARHDIAFGLIALADLAQRRDGRLDEAWVTEARELVEGLGLARVHLVDLPVTTEGSRPKEPVTSLVGTIPGPA